MSELDCFYGAHEWAGHESVKVKPQSQWRLQGLGVARYIGKFPREVGDGAVEPNQGERPCGLPTTQQAEKDGVTQAHCDDDIPSPRWPTPS